MAGIIEEICKKVSTGETLNSVCAEGKDFGYPPATTFRYWVLKNTPPGIAVQYEAARKLQWESWADQIADDSYKCRIGEQTETDASGNIVKVKTGDSVERSRLGIDAKKWLLSKLLPKQYGDKVDVQNTHHAGDTLTELMLKMRNGSGQ